jgi:hypothetical protein
MTERLFQMRLQCRYDQPDNKPADVTVERFGGQHWHPFELGYMTPGFEAFVYVILHCQHTYMRKNAAERNLVLDSAVGSIEVTADDEWNMRKLHIHFDGRLKSGTPTDDDIVFIVERMGHCPVSTNLKTPPDTETTVSFSLAAG